jgi:hypothetical protein
MSKLKNSKGKTQMTPKKESRKRANPQAYMPDAEIVAKELMDNLKRTDMTLPRFDGYKKSANTVH